MWTFTLGDYRYRLDNIPWYVRGIACYDVVEAVSFNPDEVPIFTRVIEHSGHLTIRLILSGERTAPTLLVVLAEFDELGAAGEVDPHRGLIALDIPPNGSSVAAEGAPAERVHGRALGLQGGLRG